MGTEDSKRFLMSLINKKCNLKLVTKIYIIYSGGDQMEAEMSRDDFFILLYALQELIESDNTESVKRVIKKAIEQYERKENR